MAYQTSLLYSIRSILHISLVRYNGPDKSHILSQDDVEIQAKDSREETCMDFEHYVKWLCSEIEPSVGYFGSSVVVKKLQV